MKFKYLIIVLFILVLTLNINLVSSVEDYYADIEINVYETGEVEFSGLTNHPILEGISQNYTFKDKNLWVLNLTLDEVFSEYIIKVKLPKNSKINYLKISNILSIEEENDQIIITSSGNNEHFGVITQYSISKVKKNKFLLLPILIILILLLISLVSYFILKIKNKKKININIDILTDRQKQIIDYLMKNEGHATQSELQKNIKIPKSSLSRNIDSLVRKNVIKKLQKGMTNEIYIIE